MYFAFLILFCYVLLLDFKPPPPHGPSAAEIILYFWVFTLVLEEIRQVGLNVTDLLFKICVVVFKLCLCAHDESLVSFCAEMTLSMLLFIQNDQKHS